MDILNTDNIRFMSNIRKDQKMGFQERVLVSYKGINSVFGRFMKRRTSRSRK